MEKRKRFVLFYRISVLAHFHAVAVKELKNMNAAIIDEFYAEADLMM